MSRLSQDPSDIRRAIYRKASSIILIFAVMAFLLGLNARDPAAPVRAPVEGAAAQILSITSLPVRGFENIVADTKDHFGLVKAKRELAVEVKRLQLVENEAMALRAQVSYLETLLDADIVIVGSDDYILARSVSEVNGPFVRSALINVGANKGAREGYAVMTPHGLFGRIVRTGNNSSRVLRLTDLNSRVPVQSIRSGGRAILAGDNQDQPILTFRDNQDWVVGDNVVTSGDDGVLPKGLNIGTVVESPGAQMAVELDTGHLPVDWVWVIPFTPITKPEDDPVTVPAQARTDGADEVREAPPQSQAIQERAQ